MDLGWVDFDLGVPPSCPSAQPLLPNSHQPKQNWADSGTLKIQVNPNPVHEQMNYPVGEEGTERDSAHHKFWDEFWDRSHIWVSGKSHGLDTMTRRYAETR